MAKASKMPKKNTATQKREVQVASKAFPKLPQLGTQKRAKKQITKRAKFA